MSPDPPSGPHHRRRLAEHLLPWSAPVARPGAGPTAPPMGARGVGASTVGGVMDTPDETSETTGLSKKQNAVMQEY